MLLLLHPLFHVPADPYRRFIEAIGELAELVISWKLYMGVQISMTQGPHAVTQLLNRLGEVV